MVQCSMCLKRILQPGGVFPWGPYYLCKRCFNSLDGRPFKIAEPRHTKKGLLE